MTKERAMGDPMERWALEDEVKRLKVRNIEQARRIRRLEEALMRYKRPEFNAMTPDEWADTIGQLVDGGEPTVTERTEHNA